jgi:3-carboxy-cis,cis-muconate cycloisomerase
VLARGGVRAGVDDRAWLAAMLEVEAALARAQAAAGRMPAAAAEAIGAACARVATDMADLVGELSGAAAASGNPVVPLVHRLREAVGAEVAAQIHKGATSQDILDTAAMLVVRRALGPLLADLTGAADAAAALASRHRDTAMAARTLLRQAMPTTFGLKAASWMVGLDEVAAELTRIRQTRLAVQLGGAAGTLAAFGPDGPAVIEHLAAELRLAVPVLPWHTIRTRPAELAGALGSAAGVLGKVARDVILLAQDEVGEVTEGAPGGSSAMPHKRNPVAAVSAAAAAAQAPGLVATLLATMVQEHERAAGGWHAEWRPLPHLLTCVGSAAAWLRDCLEHLRVEPAAMQANLEHLLRMLGGVDPADDLAAAARLVDHALAARASGPHGVSHEDC